jgi:hypothetical protein
MGIGLSVGAALTLAVSGCETTGQSSVTPAQHAKEPRPAGSSSPDNTPQQAQTERQPKRAAGEPGGRNDSGHHKQETNHETAVSEVTDTQIPGNRIIHGTVLAIRSSQIQVDIGNPKPLYLPLKPAHDKGLTFKEGDAIVITMNDHNAVVDYHHPDGQQAKNGAHHDVIRGQLAEQLAVGMDKAAIRTTEGKQSYDIASRARSKLATIPVGVDAVFLRDETGQLVDAQLTTDSDQTAARHTKARVKGAHEQVQAVFKGTESENRIKVSVPAEQKDRVMPFRPPLQKLDRLQENQNVVLLVDEEGYVVEIATPDTPPVR